MKPSLKQLKALIKNAQINLQICQSKLEEDPTKAALAFGIAYGEMRKAVEVIAGGYER